MSKQWKKSIFISKYFHWIKRVLLCGILLYAFFSKTTTKYHFFHYKLKKENLKYVTTIISPLMMYQGGNSKSADKRNLHTIKYHLLRRNHYEKKQD